MLPAGAILHHSHNEGRRSKADAGTAKAMGQQPGFADLIILYLGVVYFIEFKSGDGEQTPDQVRFEAGLHETGFTYYTIIRSVDEFVSALSRWNLAKAGARAL